MQMRVKEDRGVLGLVEDGSEPRAVIEDEDDNREE